MFPLIIAVTVVDAMLKTAVKQVRHAREQEALRKGELTEMTYGDVSLLLSQADAERLITATGTERLELILEAAKRYEAHA